MPAKPRALHCCPVIATSVTAAIRVLNLGQVLKQRSLCKSIDILAMKTLKISVNHFLDFISMALAVNESAGSSSDGLALSLEFQV